MRLISRILALFSLCLAAVAGAQTVPLPTTGTTLIGAEGITITATTCTGSCAYYFGTGTTFNLVPKLTLPVLISCSVPTSAGCVALGGDPAPGVAKSIYAVQQATAYTVTTSASKTPVSVPALPAPVSTTKTWTTTCTVPLTYTQTTTAAGVTTNAVAGSFTCPAVVQQ